MINFLKQFVSVILIAGACIGLHAQELDIRDDFGRTELMNYVILQEIVIAAKQQEVACLFDTCYEYRTVYLGRIHNEPIYSTVLCRKASCMDKDIQALQDCKKDLAACMSTTVIDINAFVAAGAQLKAYDHGGNTVLNYCKTYEIYKALIDHGVPFQYGAWAYFNPGQTAIATVAMVALTAYVIHLYQQGYLSYDACLQLKNNIAAGLITTSNDVQKMITKSLEYSYDLFDKSPCKITVQHREDGIWPELL